MGGFQNVVNITPAPAVEGDFASSNPRASVLAGPGGLVAGPGGVTVGRFGWIQPDMRSVQNYGTAPAAPDGFVHREQQALITTYLAIASMVIPAGFGMTLMASGDFWAKNNGPGVFVKGGTVYARYSDGSIFQANPSGASATGSIGSTNTAALGSTFTATATGTSLVVTAVTGLISIGDVISGTGVPAGTTIVAQVSGTTGGAGTYTTSVVTTAAAATVTSFGTTVNVSATTGLISIGDSISGGAGFPATATVLAQVSGTTGGAGVYTISAPGTAYVASAIGVTTFGDVLDVTAVASGTLLVGDPITGTGVPTNASIASQVSGTAGGLGIYTLNKNASAYAASTALTGVAGVATAWVAAPTSAGDGAVGALVKITTQAQ